MNKNTTDITLSAYFNDIVIGYYEDEDLVKQFGRGYGHLYGGLFPVSV